MSIENSKHYRRHLLQELFGPRARTFQGVPLHKIQIVGDTLKGVLFRLPGNVSAAESTYPSIWFWNRETKASTKVHQSTRQHNVITPKIKQELIRRHLW